MIYLNDLSFYCMFRLVYLLGCCINHKPSSYLPLVTSGQLCGGYDKIKYQTTMLWLTQGLNFLNLCRYQFFACSLNIIDLVPRISIGKRLGLVSPIFSKAIIKGYSRPFSGLSKKKTVTFEKSHTKN